MSTGEVMSNDSIILEFNNKDEDLAGSLSAALFAKGHLWVASDEATSVERLSTSDNLTFGQHRSFPLGDFVRLPALGSDFDQEIDIEGMEFQDDFLWVVGSHSVKRKNVKKAQSGNASNGPKQIKRLAKIERAGNRYILARIPMVSNDHTGEVELSALSGDKRSAQLPGGVDRNALTDAIRGAMKGEGDPHLASFMDIPGKDNGFDIEGLAIAGERVFIGLRGPVLRGWAVILEVSFKTGAGSHLDLMDIGPSGGLYRKHFLHLKGLGLRDMFFAGADLIMLAGPTMDLDGPTVVLKWEGAANSGSESLIRSADLKMLFTVPHGDGDDHAEGMTMMPADGGPARVFVVYDSPANHRILDSNRVRAEVFRLT
jgi:Protein of unknown function (DUF3616)